MLDGRVACWGNAAVALPKMQSDASQLNHLGMLKLLLATAQMILRYFAGHLELLQQSHAFGAIQTGSPCFPAAA
jgi:hypothetical protein